MPETNNFHTDYAVRYQGNYPWGGLWTVRLGQDSTDYLVSTSSFINDVVQHLLPISTFFNRSVMIMLWISRYQCCIGTCASAIKCLGKKYQYWCPSYAGLGPLGKKWEIITRYICHSVRGSFIQRMIMFSLVLISRSEKGLTSGNLARGHAHYDCPEAHPYLISSGYICWAMSLVVCTSFCLVLRDVLFYLPFS